MPKARTRKAPADLGDVHTDALELDTGTGDIVEAALAAERQYDPPAALEVRPNLQSSRQLARSKRADDWVEVRCTVSNVHTSLGVLKSGATDFLPPDEAEYLDGLDMIKKV